MDTDRVTEEMRSLSLELRPSILDDLGLRPALEWYVRRFQQSTNIRTLLDITGLDRQLASEVETVTFRCVQEALTNAARHAQATTIRIAVHEASDQLKVTVLDNGIGFNPDEVFAHGSHESRGQGLSGIRGRVALVGGNITITSSHYAGTRIEFCIPLISSR